MKPKYIVFILINVVSLFLLCGCIPEPKIAVVGSTHSGRNAETQLSNAADSVSKSLQELAEIEKATHPQAKLPSPPEPDMIGMGQIASLDWTGPIGPLVKKIAAVTNYKLHVIGNPPGIPILVSISAKDIPLADILRDAGFQCGNKANIVIYPASKLIELRYTQSV